MQACSDLNVSPFWSGYRVTSCRSDMKAFNTIVKSILNVCILYCANVYICMNDILADVVHIGTKHTVVDMR